jgi:hypothetical protein
VQDDVAVDRHRQQSDDDHLRVAQIGGRQLARVEEMKRRSRACGRGGGGGHTVVVRKVPEQRGRCGGLLRVGDAARLRVIHLAGGDSLGSGVGEGAHAAEQQKVLRNADLADDAREGPESEGRNIGGNKNKEPEGDLKLRVAVAIVFADDEPQRMQTGDQVVKQKGDEGARRHGKEPCRPREPGVLARCPACR